MNLNEFQKSQMEKSEVKASFESVKQKVLFLSKLPLGKELANELSNLSRRTEIMGNMFDIHFNNISLERRLFLRRGHKALYEAGVGLRCELVKKHEWIINEKRFCAEVIEAYASAISILQNLLESWLKELNPESYSSSMF